MLYAFQTILLEKGLSKATPFSVIIVGLLFCILALFIIIYFILLFWYQHGSIIIHLLENLKLGFYSVSICIFIKA